MTTTSTRSDAGVAVTADAVLDTVPTPTRRRRLGKKKPAAAGPSDERGIISTNEWSRRGIRRSANGIQITLLVLLAIGGLGPILWLAKAAITPTQDTLRTPMALFPNGFAWDNVSKAWTTIGLDVQFMNTVWVALGVLVMQLVVTMTAGYVLAILKPAYAKVLNALVLATLFVPSVVLLVPLYLTILDVPFLGISLQNTFWAVWLPAGANAFNILLVKRFFENLPPEIFEAARTEGAGSFRIFWQIVLPLSKPIIGVVSVFAVIAAWKDFLWPKLVLALPEVQPLSVRLPQLQQTIDLGTYLAALAISTLVPIVLFIIFQGLFLKSAGMGGAVKG